MTPETYVEWLRRQGHHILRTQSSYWYNAGPRVLQAFPYHWLIEPSEKEIQKLMIGRGIVSLRYSTPLESPEGMASYHVVLYNPYNLEMLRAQARNGVKKGSNLCQVERIPFERMADEGWNLQQDTMDRQGRLSSMTQAEWQRLCLAARDLPGFEAWAAIANGELAAAQIIAQVEDICYVPFACSHRKFLNFHVNNVVFFTVSSELLARPGVAGIFFCLHSLDAPPSVDEFKFRMSFIPKPVRQRVVFHPWLKPVTSWRVHAWLVKLTQRYPESPALAKAEGMLRFSLKGKIPIGEQEWPEVLAEEKSRWVGSVTATVSSS
jgi:hypothetical protein